MKVPTPKDGRPLFHGVHRVVLGSLLVVAVGCSSNDSSSDTTTEKIEVLSDALSETSTTLSTEPGVENDIYAGQGSACSHIADKIYFNPWAWDVYDIKADAEIDFGKQIGGSSYGIDNYLRNSFNKYIKVFNEAENLTSDDTASSLFGSIARELQTYIDTHYPIPYPDFERSFYERINELVALTRETCVTDNPSSSSESDSGVVEDSLSVGGGGHACAVIDGGLQCWGNNRYGQVGEGSTDYQSKPVEVFATDSGVTAVDAGGQHTCAVIRGGVQCWGYNYHGQLGNGTTTDSERPVEVFAPDSGVTAISAGGASTCAVIRGGVQCWGKNDYGQLGNGTTTGSERPVEVLAPDSGVTAISVKAWHVCAVLSGGVMCWGYNYAGGLGDGTTDTRLSPVEVLPADSGVTAIDTGTQHTCAVVRGGLKCWGEEEDGDTDPEPIRRLWPEDVLPANSGVTGISTGSTGSCVVVKREVQCWGYNWDPLFGDGDFNEYWPRPKSINPPVSGVDAVGLGYRYGCAVALAPGTRIWCWDRSSSKGFSGVLLVFPQ